MLIPGTACLLAYVGLRAVTTDMGCLNDMGWTGQCFSNYVLRSIPQTDDPVSWGFVHKRVAFPRVHPFRSISSVDRLIPQSHSRTELPLLIHRSFPSSCLTSRSTTLRMLIRRIGRMIGKMNSISNPRRHIAEEVSSVQEVSVVSASVMKYLVRSQKRAPTTAMYVVHQTQSRSSH